MTIEKNKRKIVVGLSILIIIFCLSFFLLNKCTYSFASGGTVGNIEASVIHSGKQTADKCLQRLKLNKVWFDSPDSVLYKSDENLTCALIKDDLDTLVFGYKTTNVEGEPNQTLLILTHFGKYREPIVFNSELTNVDRKRCLKVFHESIVENMKKSCGLACDIDVW